MKEDPVTVKVCQKEEEASPPAQNSKRHSLNRVNILASLDISTDEQTMIVLSSAISALTILLQKTTTLAKFLNRQDSLKTLRIYTGFNGDHFIKSMVSSHSDITVLCNGRKLSLNSSFRSSSLRT